MEVEPQVAVAPATRLWEWGLVALLAVGFAPAFVSMSEVWSSADYHSHGYLVPLVALWAASGKRRILPGLPRERDTRGMLVLGLALLLYLVGVGTSLVSVEGLSVVIGVAGTILYLRGSAWLAALAFPVAYLLFMVPIPEVVVSPTIVTLQLFVSSAGVGILQLAGVPVFRDGNVIELPGGATLFVADACSGITSVITLLPLGVFLAYFTERTWGRRLVLVSAVVPLAMIGNLIRVIGTVLAAREVGAAAATSGTVHESAGILTYVLGCLALLAIGWVMRVVVPPTPPS